MAALRILTIAALTTAGLALAAPSLAGGGGGGGICPAFAVGDSTEVVLLDNCFGPISATAEAGSTITIRNGGQQPHTYTAVDGSFDTGTIQPGGSMEIELPETGGTLPVYCTFHADRSGNGMAGTITVDLAAAEATAAAPNSAGLGSQGLALAGGFALVSTTLATLRRRHGNRTSRSLEA